MKYTILFSLAILISCKGICQEKRFRLGVEPKYNYLILGNQSSKLFDSYSSHIYGVGFILEKYLQKHSNNFSFNSGIYYYFSNSNSESSYTILTYSDEPEGEVEVEVFTDTRISSKSIWIPLKLTYQYNMFYFSGGVSFHYTIKDKIKDISITTIPDDNYIEEANYNPLDKKLQFGLDFNLGLQIKLRDGITLIPNLDYNLQFNRDRYMGGFDFGIIGYHGIGIGCKLLFYYQSANNKG